MSKITFTQNNHFNPTEIGEIPEEWEEVRLGDYCRVFSGFAFKSDDFVKRGILVVKIGNLQNGTIVIDNRTNYFPENKIKNNIAKFILKEGDILIAMTGATTGKVAVVPKKYENSLLNQRVGKFDIFSDELDKSFFRYFAITKIFQGKVFDNILKSAQGNVSPKQIENINIILPPLPEQKSIASVLSTIQTAKEKTERVIQATKELKKSMMKHLFTYGPVSLEEAEKVKLKETEIGKMPEEWEVVELGDLSNSGVIKIRFGFPCGKWNDKKIGVPHIRPFNISDFGKINLQNLKYIITDKKLENYFLRIGDVLFNNTNSEDLVGKTAYWSYQNGNFVISNHMTIIRIINKNILNSNFLSEYLHKRWYDGFYKTICRRHVNQSSISLARLKIIKIPLPSLPTQQKIASILSSIDEKIQAEEKKKQALESLFKSMLHNLMSGRLRVRDYD